MRRLALVISLSACAGTVEPLDEAGGGDNGSAGGAAAGGSSAGGAPGSGGNTPTAGASGGGAPGTGGTPAGGSTGGGGAPSGGSTGGGGTPGGNPDAGAPAPDVAPSAPLGCGNAAMCLTFEDGKVPAGWTLVPYSTDPVPKIDNTRAYTGSYSLHYTMNGGDGYRTYLMTNNVPNRAPTLYVRYYIYTTAASVYYSITVAADGDKVGGGLGRYTQNIDGRQIIGAYAQDRNCRWNMQDMYRTRCTDTTLGCTQTDITRSQIPIGKWTCVEVGLDGAAGTPTQIWVDGQKLKLGTTQAAWPKMANFSRLEIGYQECHIYNSKQVWIDDVAVATSPIGCN